MATASKTVPAQSGDIQLAAQTYQQSMQNLSAVVSASTSEGGVVILQPGQLSVVQVQAGKQYKLRKSSNPNQTPDDLIAVRHGDALHVRYADGSVVHFEEFYSTCTDSSVCSVNLAGDEAAGVTLSADAVNAGPAADDGVLVYAHGNPDVLMSMAEGQADLSAALQGVDASLGATALSYVAPTPYLGMGLLALTGAGALAATSSTVVAAVVNAGPTLAEQQTALKKIGTAAEANNASGTATVSALTRDDYKTAGVTGVSDGATGNLAAINSALDTLPIARDQANTATKLQAIVDAYSAILNSADGVAANTPTALTGEQYAAIGISGVPNGSPTEGSALKLLDEMVDKSAASDVNTAAKVQTKADAAVHLIAAAGGTASEAAKLSVVDLTALGFTNVNADNIDAVRAAIKATIPDSAIDQLSEVKAIVDTAVAAAVDKLVKISTAAGANNAGGASGVLPLSVDDYVAASVTGVSSANLVAINSALDSASVTAEKANTVGEVQDIVNAYEAIITSANSTAGSTPLTADQFTLIGVTGVSGSPTADGTALKLLNDVVDVSAPVAVATEPLLQNMATAASHLMDAAGGTAAQAANLTAADLQALGISMGALDISAVRAALQSVTNDASVDTKSELQSFVSHIVAPDPVLSTTLGGVTDLDVTSNLVFTSSVAVNVGTGKIHITDLGGINSGTGYHGDVNNNSVDIDMATAIGSGLVTLDATHTKITINPKWDLDLSSNYSISIDAGAFVDPTNGHLSQAVAALNFSTVAPGTRVAGHAVALDASASHAMDNTGALVASTAWLDVEGLGNITGLVTQLGDLSTGSYTLVAKNYAARPGGPNGDQSDGIRLADTNVGVTNFGANDYIYFDSQVNDISMQAFDAAAVGMVQGDTFGGLAGQNAMDMATASSLSPQAAGARIMLGLEGNTTGKQYSTINQDGVNHGWATDWHAASQPVLMG